MRIFTGAATSRIVSRPAFICRRSQKAARWLPPHSNRPQVPIFSKYATQTPFNPAIVMEGQTYYAVRKGRQTGIFHSWSECEKQVKRFPGHKYKKFSTASAAQAYLEGESNTTASKPSEGSSRGRKRPFTSVSDESEWMVVHTDGACKGNGQPGSVAGVGVFWGPNDPRNIAERCPGDQTNNRAELIAIIRALETVPVNKKLLIKTDSQYSINCFQHWLPTWQRNGFRVANGSSVKNIEIIKYLSALLQQRGTRGQQVFLQHVKGHSGESGNDGADLQANIGTTLPPCPDLDWTAMEARASETIEALVSLKPRDVPTVTATEVAAGPSSSMPAERPTKLSKSSSSAIVDSVSAVREGPGETLHESHATHPVLAGLAHSHFVPGAVGTTSSRKPTIYERPPRPGTSTSVPTPLPIHSPSPAFPTAPRPRTPPAEGLTTTTFEGMVDLPSATTSPLANRDKQSVTLQEKGTLKPPRPPRSPFKVTAVEPPLVPASVNDIDLELYKDCLLEGEEWEKEIENL